MAIRQSPAQIVELDRIGAVTLCVATTSTPWLLDIDTLVLSAGPRGLGSLGQAFEAARPDVSLPSISQLAAIVPHEPLVVPVELEGAYESSSFSGAESMALAEDPDASLRRVVLATVREDITGRTPVPVATAAVATLAAVTRATESGARSVAMPLLGTGFVKLDQDLVIPAVLTALRNLYTTTPAAAAERLVLVTRDPETTQKIRDSWLQIVRGVQLTMVADLPIDDPRLDILGTNAYAEALAFLIDHPSTSTPLTIAINAPWGAGKTSVAKLTERRLQTFLLRSRKPIICWFNAWHHDDAPNIATALASVAARTADAGRPLWRRWVDPLPTQMLRPQDRRRRWLVTTLFLAAIALVVLLASGAFHALTTGKVTLTVVITLLAAIAREFSTVRGTASQLSGLVRAPESALSSGSLDDVRSDLGRLIHRATRRGGSAGEREHRRFVVFIDDLERCQPERSIEVCETVNTLLSHEDVVVVLIGDMQTLATAAEAKYKALAPRYRTGTLGNQPGEMFVSSFGELYLEKIVQFRFDLPTHDLPALAALAHRLEETSGKAASDRPPTPQRRHGRLRRKYSDWRELRHLLKRSGPTLSLDADDRDATAGATYSTQLSELMSLIDRTEGPSLQRSFDAVATLVRPLPRDLKRLLNRIRFYLYLLERRGLLAPAGKVPPEAVGKWALLAERWPDLAVAISADPPLMGSLEASAKTVEGFIASMGREVPGYAHSAELQRLLVSAPPLGELAMCLSRLMKDSTAESEGNSGAVPVA